MEVIGVKCSLKGISPTSKDSNWSHDANIRFESLVLDHRLIVHFEKPNPKFDVCFITKMKDENGVDIFEELVKSGVAEREPRQGGTSKPSASPSAKVGTKKTKDVHQGEGKAVLPDPVQKTLKVNNSITVEITGINQSGHSFYGYMKESEGVLQKLQACLQECYNDSQPTTGQR
ncbi:hypothetical protein HOLleu_33709 [Holothuria leucospilota]|uniref:Uncharacterized protein n=1 Tax=Holothuria leucospilota TaxID=206669 RepID=A0A9Q0YSU7_HOLLE|nr:hypothetical protein HOLleu_33709 [Holothuria leucospilota]